MKVAFIIFCALFCVGLCLYLHDRKSRGSRPGQGVTPSSPDEPSPDAQSSSQRAPSQPSPSAQSSSQRAPSQPSTSAQSSSQRAPSRPSPSAQSSSQRDPSKPGGSGSRSESSEEDSDVCCGMHLTCEKDSLLADVSDRIEYFDDEELDRFASRPANSYTPAEIEEFREILLTLLPTDISPWARSIQLRGITLPTEIREELLFLVAENRRNSD